MSSISREEVMEEIKLQAKSVALMTHDPSESPSPVDPRSLNDLSSLGSTQLILRLEDHYEILIMEDMIDFTGSTFDALAEFLVQRIDHQGRQEELESNR